MKLPEEICNETFNSLDVDTKRWLVTIIQEFNKAKEKHPEWPGDEIHQAAIVGEEAGELLQAALQYRYESGRYYDISREAIQTGAMALRMLTNTKDIEQLKRDERNRTLVE